MAGKVPCNADPLSGSTGRLLDASGRPRPLAPAMSHPHLTSSSQGCVLSSANVQQVEAASSHLSMAHPRPPQAPQLLLGSCDTKAKGQTFTLSLPSLTRDVQGGVTTQAASDRLLRYRVVSQLQHRLSAKVLLRGASSRRKCFFGRILYKNLMSS